MALAENGDFLVRIEDIDQSRARAEWEAQIFDDLKWLGLWWPEPVMRQSARQPAYTAALDRLWQQGLLYACTCSRADIKQALSAPQEGVPTHGPDGLIYPGTCRGTYPADMGEERPKGVTLRLNMAIAAPRIIARFERHSGLPEAHFTETGMVKNAAAQTIKFTADDLMHSVGDIVLARRDMGTSYHLSVVLDDAAQGITHVVRGEDLYEATKIHVVLQRLLGLPTPVYHHHKLIRDDAGKRLAKRDDARAISLYRSEGASPQDIRDMIGL